MDNAADDPNQGAIPNPPPDDNFGGPPADGGEDGENVDQFYDDGGETFLPADHVSVFLKRGRFKLFALLIMGISLGTMNLSMV